MIQRAFPTLFGLFFLTVALCLSVAICPKANASRPSNNASQARLATQMGQGSQTGQAIQETQHAPTAQPPHQYWAFRHSVEIFLPAFNLTIPFDGLIELSCDSGDYKALGAIKAGVTLFTLTAPPTAQTVQTVHPSLRHLPHFEENLRAAMRLVNHELITALTYGAHTNDDGPYTTKRVIHKDALTQTIIYLGKRVTTIHESGPNHTWILNAYYPLNSKPISVQETDVFPYPERITLHNLTHNVMVDITTIFLQRMSYENPSE